MVVVKDPWGDGRDCPVRETACLYRSCLHVGENKGPYSQGRGYTSYYKDPKLVCMTRHVHGCPQPDEDLDPEKARCCLKPDFAAVGSLKTPRKQRCRTCGQWADGLTLSIRKNLPVLPHVECRHKRVIVSDDGLFTGKRVCLDCHLYWDHDPKPLEPGKNYRELLDERFRFPGKDPDA